MRIVSILLLSLSVITSIMAVPKAVDVTKGNFYYRTSLQATGDNGFGFFALAGFKHNFYYSQEVNGVVKDSTLKGVLFEELRFGPTWETKLGSSKILTKLVYHPTYNTTTYDQYYLRHIVELEGNLYNPLIGKSKLHSRVILINNFGGSDGSGNDLDNEAFVRVLTGPIIPISKVVSAVVEAEMFIKPTADVGDADGEETINKYLLWTGVDVALGTYSKLQLRYNGQYIDLADSGKLSKSVFDHTAYANIIFMIK